MTATPESSPNALQTALKRPIRLNWEVWAYIILFALAIFTRFYMVGDRVMSHDESLHTRFSWNLYNDGDFRHTPLMHGPILFHAVAFSYSLFGDNDFTARIYTSVLGVLMVLSPLLFRHWLGRWGALIASLLMLISPLLMYYNRYIREDTPAIMASILMFWAILMYLSGPAEQRRQPKWLYILAAAMIWNLGSKETAFMYIAVIGALLALYWFIRMAQFFFGVAGKTLFNLTSLGVLFGGVLTLAMYIILDIIKFDLFSGPDDLAFNQLSASYQGLYFLWTFLAILLILAVIIGTGAWIFRDRLPRLPKREIAYIFGVMMLTAFALVVLEERSHTVPSETSVASPVAPGDEGSGAESTSGLRWYPMIGVWAVSIAASAVFIVGRRRRDHLPADTRNNIEGQGLWGRLDLFPEFDVMVVIGTLILPWATALIPYVMRGTSADFAALGNNLPAFLSGIVEALPDVNGAEQIGQFMLHFLTWLPLMATAIIIGISWNWKVWLIAAGIFHAIFVFFFTTVFTNMAGLATGMIYSLGYWLEQQGVRRGSQPQYYYLLVIMPFYEFLPVIGGVCAMLAGSLLFWRRRRAELDREQAYLTAEMPQDELDDGYADNDGDGVPDKKKKRKRDQFALNEALSQDRVITELPFLYFWSWIAVFNLIVFSLAGEKMPWLGTHLTFPLIFLTAWYLGGIVSKLEWGRFKLAGWRILPLYIVSAVALAQAIGVLVAGNPPFSGLSTQQLRDTYNFLASLAVGFAFAFIVWRMTPQVGVRHVRQLGAIAIFGIMGVLTFRMAWQASFINYDHPTEYLVYAHGAPAIKTVLDQIEELSLRTTDGNELKFAYDNEVSWPYSWYFRDYAKAVFVGSNPTVQNLQDAAVVVVGAGNRGKVEPILEDRYQRFDHMRLWWPMQEYFNLTPERLLNVLDFSPANTNAADLRRGIFDIWWSRDYTTYGNATSKNYNLENWPVSDTMHVYIRKDIAAQVWAYGTGEGGVIAASQAPEVNQCNANYQSISPSRILVALDTPMNRPLGMALDAQGNLYVAEEYGHRISVFNSAGQYVRSIGTQGTNEGGIRFNRPNSVALNSAGDLVVADTWNFRISQIANNGETLRTQWGQAGTFGFDAPMEPSDAFWGPRDVHVDSRGRVYVSDTGNKRVRVYDLSSGVPSYLYDIGSGGSGLGQLDEPSGLAIHPEDGRVFVADTWNRRVSIFTEEGAFITSFPVRAWYEEQGNRPYLAIDAVRDVLYIGDPDTGRVLVYNLSGECLGSFGRALGQASDGVALGVTGGLVVNPVDGSLYVADASFNRILLYPSFVELVRPSDDGAQGAGAGGMSVGQDANAEQSAESGADGFDDVALEATEEATSAP